MPLSAGNFKYLCQFINKKTGEKREAIVKLSWSETFHVMHQRGGSPDHPLGKTLAAMRGRRPGEYAMVDGIYCIDPSRTH
jgi:hypothetical protein